MVTSVKTKCHIQAILKLTKATLTRPVISLKAE
jgi:hypothetical protein